MGDSSEKLEVPTLQCGSAESAKILGRRGLPEIALWPQIDEFSLSKTHRLLFARRRTALEMYASGAKLTKICDATSLNRAEIYRLLKRALAQHSDGRIWGMRALIPWRRVAASFRTSASTQRPTGWAGPGAFSALLERHPNLDKFVRDKVLKRTSAGKVQESRVQVRKLHGAFLQECRKLGLNSREDYPFSTKMCGYVSFAAYVRGILAESTSRAIGIKYGDEAVKKMRVGDGIGRPIQYPYERVECDAHLIDAMFCILCPTAHGDFLPVAVPRLWVLAIKDVESRVVLGHYLSLNKECNESDLLKCIKSALTQWTPRNLSGTRLSYRPSGGFPSKLGAEFVGVCWDEFSVDGAKINLSERVGSKLDSIVGAKVEYRPRRIPDDRPFIERFFGTLEENGFHRLPNTTGTGPSDIRRQQPEVAACKYFIQLEDLRNLLDILIANYNGEVHSNLNGRTPLEYLAWSQHKFRDIRPFRHADALEVQRINSIRARVRVCGKEGRRPYINFKNAAYSCAAFSHTYELVGQYLTIEADEDEARTVFAYMPNGDELGPLLAAPPWDREPHSFWMRKKIVALIRAHRWNPENFSDPITALLEDLEEKAQSRKFVTSEYLQLREYMLEKKNEFRQLAEEGPANFPIPVIQRESQPAKLPAKLPAEVMPAPRKALQRTTE